MVRVYLDWNIFSYLRHFSEIREPYISLNRYLNNHKGSILIPYTSAHLTDLITSYKSSEKGRIETMNDLDYLAKITNHNCIIYDYNKKKTYCDKYDLYDYFEDLLESDQIQYSSVEQLFSSFDTPGLSGVLNSFVELLKVIPTGINTLSLYNDRKSAEPLYNMMKNTLTGGSFYDVLSDTINLVQEYNNNHKAYRGIRNASLEELKLNFDYSTSEDPIAEISKHLKSSGFKKTFQELSETLISNYFGNKDPSRFDLFSNKYILLDFLGYYKDQQLKNLLQDAFHAYYGAHCDFFVTDDRNTLNKAKVIYDHFNIETVVCTSQEFNSKFFGKVILNPISEAPIIEVLPQIINTAFVVSKKYDDHFNPVDVYRIDHYVLNFFDRLQITYEPDGSYSIYLYKRNQTYSRFYFWPEVESVVNSIVKQFGTDIRMRRLMDMSKEKTEIREDNWPGRNWVYGNTEVAIVWDKEFGIMLTLWMDTSNKNYDYIRR
jgi:hypothetical protein